MRSMIIVVARPLAVRRSVPGGQLVGGSERAPDTDRDVAARMRQLLAPRPDTVRAGDPERDDRRARAQREDRQAVTRLLERAIGAARAFREDEQDVALVEDPLGQAERLDVGRAAIDRVDAAVAPRPSRRSASRTAPSCRASGSAARASASATSRARPRRGSRRGWRPGSADPRAGSRRSRPRP